MKVLRYPQGDILEVPGNSFADVPSGGAGFLQNRCDFCQQITECLVIDNTSGEYSPASICECCLTALRSLRPEGEKP